MRTLALATSLALLSVPSAARAEAPQALGLTEILAGVRARSPALEAARSQVAVADAQVDQAWTAWQPRLDAIGRLTVSSVEVVLDFNDPDNPLPPMFAELLPEPTVIQPQVQLAGIVQLQQTLFNISVLRAPDVAKAARAAVVADVDALEDDLTFSAATLYTNLLGLEGLEAAAKRAEEVAEQRIADAKLQIEAGTATPLSATRAETDRATAEGERIRVSAQRRRLVAQLGLLLGADGPLEVRAEPLGPFLERPGDGPEARRSVRAADKKRAAAEAQVGLHDMKWLPTLAAEGTLLYQNFDGFAGTPFLAQGIFTLAIPIYDGGERYAATRLARAQVVAAERGLALARREARAYLDTARADLVAAQAELDQAAAQLALAKASVEQAENLASGGLATALELADADARRFSADRLVAQKRLALDLARLRVHYASGGRLGSE